MFLQCPKFKSHFICRLVNITKVCMIVPIKVQEYDSCLGFERSWFQIPDKPPFVTSPKKVQGNVTKLSKWKKGNREAKWLS